MEVTEFPSFDLDLKKPLQQQIHAQLVHWFSSGRLQPGLRLPATRVLSQQLGVSRNTVSAVIDQLKAEGFVESQIGRGSFISRDLPTHKVDVSQRLSSSSQQPPEVSKFAQQLIGVSARHHQSAQPFTPGVPDLSAFPQSIWKKLWRQHQDRLPLMGYDHDQGLLVLREALVAYLTTSRGVHCDADQIVITQGAQQALSLCAHLLLNEGDAVLHENPGYKGASHAFLARLPNMIHVPLKSHALDVDWVVQNTNVTAQAKLMYVSPTHQYPMGGLLSASDRLSLLTWAEENSVWILEDDYDSEFHFMHKPVAAMQGMTAANNVIYMGSFSKTIFPSLRLGYLVLPKPLVETFTVAKSFFSGESPLVPQAVIADFIQEGHFVRHLRKMRQLYKTKWQAFESIIQRELSEQVTVIAESAGMHLALEIPNIDDVQLSGYLKKNGFGSSPLSSYYLGQTKKTGLVLGFANASEQQQIQLIDCLKYALRSKINTKESL